MASHHPRGTRPGPQPSDLDLDPILGRERLEPRPSARAQPAGGGRRAEILVVDDSEDDRLLFQEAFGRLGLPAVRVEFAENVEDALDRIRRRPPDLVVLDLSLPGRSGHDLLRDAKADPATRGVPIVVFSSSPRSCDVTSSYLLGAASYVQKPQDLDEYARVVGLLVLYWMQVAQLH